MLLSWLLLPWLRRGLSARRWSLLPSGPAALLARSWRTALLRWVLVWLPGLPTAALLRLSSLPLALPRLTNRRGRLLGARPVLLATLRAGRSTLLLPPSTTVLPRLPAWLARSLLASLLPPLLLVSRWLLATLPLLALEPTLLPRRWPLLSATRWTACLAALLVHLPWVLQLWSPTARLSASALVLAVTLHEYLWRGYGEQRINGAHRSRDGRVKAAIRAAPCVS